MPPSPSRVVVRFEKSGRAGKAVTLISGLALHPEGKQTLLSELKKKLGSGGTVKDGVLELQGDHRERLIACLTERGFQVTRGN